MTYIEKAVDKFTRLKEGIVDDTKSFEEYLGFCYINFRPNEYGKLIQKRIEDYFGFVKIGEKNEKGDCHFRTTNDNKLWFEVKVSYLGKNDTYSVRYIRPWQDFDYYLLCFVNPLNCKPNYFVLTCHDIIKNFKCHYMNGTKESNKSNSKSAYGITIKLGSDSYKKLFDLNRLSGNDGLHVFEFLAKQNIIK